MPLFSSLKSLLGKLDSKARETAGDGGLAPAKVENGLVMYSSGRVVPVVAARNIFWIKQYQVWKQMKPTEEQVELVARWLARQTWMAPMTIDQVAYKWPSYLARALAEKKTVVSSGGRREFTDE